MAKKIDTPNYEIDWILRDRRVIDGLDHLGIELVSVNLYQAMLPGLTNVTERARYYAFYPWIIHRYAQAGPTVRSKAAWRDWIRSLDFAYAAACMAYEQELGKDLGSSVVGALLAGNWVKDKGPSAKIDLRSPAQVSETGRVPESGAYFQNPEGGFGQYYRGALRVLGAVHEHQESTWPDVRLSNYAGRKIAESLDRKKSFRKLEEFALAGNATLSDLRSIGKSIHPSAIERDSEEANILIRLFLGDDDDLCKGQRPEETRWRRDSLLLMFHYLRDAGIVEGRLDREFRWACASRALPDGKKWRIPPPLSDAARAWGAYHRNDLLNYSLECIFHVALKELDRGPIRMGELLEILSERAMAKFPKDGEHLALDSLHVNVMGWMDAMRDSQGSSVLGPWGPRSTWAMADRLETAVANKDLVTIPALVARVLGRLFSDRGISDGHPFAMVPNAVDMTSSHEVHLSQWWKRVTDGQSEGTSEFLKDLFLDWIVYRHLRVATRKLANQGVSTFKFRPEEGRLLLVAERIPDPTFTSPRIRQGFRITQDLHCISVTSAGAELSEVGQAVLGAHHA